MFSNPAAIISAVSLVVFGGGLIGAAFEDGERRVEPWAAIAQHGVERLRLGAVEIQLREHAIAALAPRVVVEQDRLPIAFALAARAAGSGRAT